MSIVVQKRPFQYCFSGNPVHYELYSALAAGDPTVSIEIRIQFKNIGGVYSPSPIIPYNPVQGISTIDIEDALDGLLEYNLPGFNGNEKTIWPAAAQTAEFYLQFREITIQNNNPSWDNSESDYERFVIKGGLSRWKYQGNNFWINYFNTLAPSTAANPFLTWQQSRRPAAVEERMYLLFLNVTTIAQANLKTIATVYYTDGSSAQVNPVPLNIAKGIACYIPSGAFQWGLDLLDPTKDIYYWEIVVNDYTNAGAPVAISQSFRYYADNKKNYNDIILSYRNSLGGLDSARIRGVIETDLDYTFTEQLITQKPDYFDGPFFTPQKVIKNSKEQVTYKGDIGHLGKEEQDRLRDIHIIRETWWEVSGKWWPMNILTKSNKLRTSIDTRWTMPIEFTHAHEGDSNYTPNAVDLGIGVFTSNVCQAYLSPLSTSVDLSGADALVTATFTEVDPQAAAAQFRYRIIQAGAVIIDWTTLAMAVGSFSFHLGKEGSFTLETQAICTNGIFGKKTSAGIDTHVATGGGGGTGGGGTGGGTGGAGASEILNFTSTFIDVEINIFNTSETIDITCGENNSNSFDVSDTANTTVKVDFHDFSPGMVTLVSNGVAYHPVTAAPGATLFTFLGVNIVSGIIIRVS